jgi:hypothetical protein
MKTSRQSEDWTVGLTVGLIFLKMYAGADPTRVRKRL